MKNRILSHQLLLCIAFFTLIASKSNAQGNLIRQQSCISAEISGKVDSLKNSILSQGFVLVKENSMSMESEYEMPIIVPLTQGSWYHFVFVGEYSSRLYEIRMYDWNEKQVIYKKNMWGDVDGPIINFSYIPQFSEYHMIKAVQMNKQKKNLCGYVMMFKKVQG